jgi:hypothetical protein
MWFSFAIIAYGTGIIHGDLLNNWIPGLIIFGIGMCIWLAFVMALYRNDKD